MPGHLSHQFPYQQPERHDELSTGVPDPEQAQASDERKAGGNGIPKGATVIPSMGGKTLRGRTHLSHQLDAPTLTPTSQSRARTLRRTLSSEIAATVGGGHCGVAASLFVKFAAQKTAAAEEAFAAGDFETHRKLSESARMDILYAREHAAKEAEARNKKLGRVDPMTAIRARIATSANAS